MDFHFGTPSRLERQIAQDLMQDQTELDLSLPGGDARGNHSMSTSTRHPLNSYMNNHASYSRASTSSAGSYRDDQSFDISGRGAKQTQPQKPALSLAAAVAMSTKTGQLESKENMQPRPSSSQSTSTSSSVGPRAKHGSTHARPADAEERADTPFSASSSVSMDDGAETSRTHHFPDPYGHLRAVSPPLTSTPQRPGPASTVGSRSRTTMTIRPSNYNTASVGGSASRSRGTMMDSTVGSATRGARSLRSAGTALDDLTESSIALEDEDAFQDAGTGGQHGTPAGARDPVVYDTVSASGISENHTGADPNADDEVRTGTMHTSEIQLPTEATVARASSSMQSATTQDDSGRGRSPDGDWRRRREALRQADNNDESMVDEEEDEPSRQAPPSQIEAAEATTNDESVMPPPTSGDLSSRTGPEAEGERSATTLSSPAAARLARQGVPRPFARSKLGLEHENRSTPQKSTAQEASTPQAAAAAASGQGPISEHIGAATPRAQTSAADHEKMKAFLLNSVKATATSGSSRKDTRIRTLERLQAQALLSQTPGRFAATPQHGESDDSSSNVDGNTPRLRMDRLGKANTVAAGRTPLPKGGIAELLRRGALSRLGDTSSRSDSAQSQGTPGATYDASSRSGVDHQTILESLAGLSEASSNDLTAPPQTSVHGPLGLRANSSFPGLGAAEIGTDANNAARPRVDPARLAVYQSKLNARLDAENEELKKERDELSRQLEELRRQNEDLRASSRSASASNDIKAAGSPVPDSDSPASEELMLERERANALDKEAQELADLLDEREREIESLHAEMDQLRDGTGKSQRQASDAQEKTHSIEEVEQLKFEIEELRAQLKEKDEDLMDLEDRLEDERKQMEQQVEQAKAYSFETLEKVEAKRDEALKRIESLESELEESRQDCDRLRAELDAQQARADGRGSAETENVELRQQVAGLTRKVQQLERDLRSARDDADAASDDVKERTEQVKALETQIEAWKAEVADLEADLEDERQRADRAEEELAERVEQDPDATAKRSEMTRSIDSHRSGASKKTATLERQLSEARAEIDHLAAQLDGVPSPSSPNASAVRGKDLEIKLLKQQKDELQARVDEYRKMISAGVGNNLALLSQQEQQRTSGSEGGDRVSQLAPTTSGQVGSVAGASPLPKSVLNLRHISPMKTPRSPAPLSEASWLYNESSLGAAGVAERIAFLESALDDANASIDAKLQKLDSAGVAHLTLAERLDRANERIAELEAELERLRMRASATAGGIGANTSISDSPNKSSRSAVQRQRVFADVHAQLEALKSRWASDHDQLRQREAEIEKREHALADRSREKREYRGVLAELERFRSAAASLQTDLHAEQERQREMLAKSKATSQEKGEIETRLMSTQAELDAVKRKLEDKMGGLENLSRQLFERSMRHDSPGSGGRNSLQAQIDSLSRQVETAQAQVEELKQERHDLLSQRADLHAKFARVNEKYESVAADLAVSRQALTAHQAQLDDQIEQMESIHAALRSKRAEYAEVVGDRDRLRAERDDIVRDVGKFEAELRRVRHEADRQGSDLEALRAERERAQRRREKEEAEKDRARERDLQQVQYLVRQLKVKTQEVEEVKAKLEEADRVRCAAPPPYSSATTQQHLIELRAQHAQECKGLMLQIRYLKAKLTRETDLRSDLAHQKMYITLLLRGLVDVDDEIGRILFDLHIESDERKRQKETTQNNQARRRWSVAIKSVRAVVRMRLMANKWQKAQEMKTSLARAHQQVRERRKEEAGEGEKHCQIDAPSAAAAHKVNNLAAPRPERRFASSRPNGGDGKR